MVKRYLTWAQLLLVAKADERLVVDLGVQRRVLVERVLGANAEQRVGGARGPLHADAAVQLVRHLLVDRPAEVLAVVAV